ncbi:MAG: hypothetical protein GX130_06785 [Candidatus Hydrogenedens sp.]|jgi:4-amino-4-deoxy-L-arabinose transferase-like glycosyltransferase|nr:hypothetical protein [Candidatus Hydrogenedens sp.]
MNTSSSSSTPFSFRLEHLALILLLLFHLFMNLWWLRLDNHGIQSDEELHMLSSRAYHEALFPVSEKHSFAERLNRAWYMETPAQSPVHPPLLPLTGALAVALFGHSLDAMAFCNTLFFLVMLVGIYRLARAFLSPREALYAVAVVSFTPMIYTASRYFMTDYLSMTLCVWALAVLVYGRNFLRTRSALLFGLINGLALLARITSPVYYFFPALFFFIQGIKDSRGERKALFRLLMNGCLAVLLTLAVAAPWYISHGNRFYSYWTDSDLIRKTGIPLAWQRESREEISDATAEAPAPEKSVVSEKSDTLPKVTSPASAPDVAATPSQSAPSEEAKEVVPDPSDKWVFRPGIPWARYPVMIINNGLFLPMFIMSVVGLCCAVLFPRFRNHAVPRALFLWVFGSWLLLTLLFSFATPRYALQLLPALALFSALPLFMLRRRKITIFLQILYLSVLLFQYGNLTVVAYGGAASRFVPLSPDPDMMVFYDDEGLYWYKDELHGSYAYSGMGAPVAQSYKDRIFLAMLKEEQERPYSGIEANYVRVNMRGMGLEELHYRPEQPGRPNPWRRKDIPEELQPWRAFRHFGWSHEPEEIRPMLLFAEYIVYTTELLAPGEEERWLRLFMEEGFELVERFHDKRHGMVGDKYFGLLARHVDEPLPSITEETDFNALEPMDLYRLRHSKAWEGLKASLQQSLLRGLNGFFQGMGRPRSVHEKLSYAGCGVSREEEELYLLHLIFRTQGVITQDLRVVVQGQVDARTMATVFGNDTGKGGLFRWPAQPSPVSSLWPENEHVIVRVPLRAKAASYQMTLSFLDRNREPWGQPLQLGVITLAE